MDLNFPILNWINLDPSVKLPFLEGYNKIIMIEVHLCVFATLVFIITSAYIDYEHLIDNDYIEDHTARWILRFCFSGVLGIINPWFFLSSGLLFWALFDQTLNFLRPNVSFWYLGTTAGTDKFFNKRKRLYITSKIICLIGSFYLFLNYYKL